MSDGVHPNPAGYTAMGNAIDLEIFTGGANLALVVRSAACAALFAAREGDGKLSHCAETVNTIYQN